jgi:hypothetical protein
LALVVGAQLGIIQLNSETDQSLIIGLLEIGANAVDARKLNNFIQNFAFQLIKSNIYS